MYVGNVMLGLINIFLIPMFVRLLRVPYELLVPIILTLCMIGAFAANNRMWDVGLLIVFGVIGYLMKRLDYSPAALVTALVLGPLAENALRQSLQLSEGRFTVFLARPIAATLMALAVAALLLPLTKRLK
jgi:putative tricarboxylic transport membrane protein